MRLLGQRLGLWRCVWLIDFNGNRNLRIARKCGSKIRALRMGPFWWPTRWSYLNPDGSIEGYTGYNSAYVKAWEWASDQVQWAGSGRSYEQI